MTDSNDQQAAARPERAAISGDRNIYDAANLPFLKRTWFWLLAGLVILGSGIIIGLALPKLLAPLPVIKTVEAPRERVHAEVATLDVRRNRSLRRLDELKRILEQDVCLAETPALETPGGVAGRVPADTPIGQIVAPPGTDPSAGAAPAANPEAAATPQQTAAPPQSGAPSPAGGATPADKPASDPSAPQQDAPAAGATPAPEPPADQSQQQQPPGQAAPSASRFGDVLGPATVLVIVDQGDGNQSIGSGFLINATDIITNAHVVAGGSGQVTVTNQVMGSTLPASVVATDWQQDVIGGNDFALLRLTRPVSGSNPLALSVRAQKAQEVIAAGFPGDDLRRLIDNGARPDSTFTRGSIRNLEQYQGRFPVINHDADLRKGNSGGPLVDKCGRVLGVNTYALNDLDFSLSTTGLLAFLKQHSEVTYRLSDEECKI